MEPLIKNAPELNSYDVITFTISGLDVSLANAIRRVILSRINTIVFKTTPNEVNTAIIKINTSRFNNEIIKQRLSSIPIHLDVEDHPDFGYYLLVVDVGNDTTDIINVTTENFNIYNTKTKHMVSRSAVRQIFPPNVQTSDFITFLRLHPRMSELIPGEQISLTCEFGVGNAMESGMYSAASTCAYGFTPDLERIQQLEMEKRLKLESEQKNDFEIVSELADWRLLDALRIVIPNSFDFTIETVGVFSNNELLRKSCDIIINQILITQKSILQQPELIKPSESTMRNCYDVTLLNDDYTIGKILEFMVFNNYYNKEGLLSYCGYNKAHPHDADSTIRLAFKQETAVEEVKMLMSECCRLAVVTFDKILYQFKKFDRKYHL